MEAEREKGGDGRVKREGISVCICSGGHCCWDSGRLGGARLVSVGGEGKARGTDTSQVQAGVSVAEEGAAPPQLFLFLCIISTASAPPPVT